MFSAGPAVIDAIERRFLAKQILVIGDAMLDRHIWGQVSRISPEAPVPVVKVVRESASPGGAGNVALNLACLGIQARLVGLIGDDANGAELGALLVKNGIDASGLVRLPGRPTTTKARVIGGHQQMLRLDTEDAAEVPASAAAELVDRAVRACADAAVVVISDYAKGVVTPALAIAVISECRRRGVPVLVDPKGREWSKYRGATILKPNRSELAAIAARAPRTTDELVAEARRLVRDLELGQVVVTLSEEGMLRIGSEEVVRLPAVAREVYDVSGAGDTVLATLAAGLAAHLHIDDAMRLSSLAAGVVISKVGTVPIHHGELLVEALSESQRAHDSKICDLEHLRHRVKLWRARGERIVFTNGCFDLLHAGHITYLEAARACGDRLLIGLNTDRSVRALKGPSRPINSEGDRALVLSSLASVDAVVLFDDDTPMALIQALRPDVLAKGADYTVATVVGAQQVQSWGGEVRLIPLVPGLSTTAIAAKVKGG
jgi:D-beta-D-heptose 7-phosphate kinase/D-beta-D-heptose 1-phosphate adenosyltransferase